MDSGLAAVRRPGMTAFAYFPPAKPHARPN
jgi:hypothetical protein